jgi:glycosyltransferase involved in cell wall biosynthesis
MALGVPVLARDIPGNASLLTHGETGLLFSGEEGYIEGIERILHEGTLARDLGTAAQRRFAAVHSLEAEGEAYVALAEQLLALGGKDGGTPGGMPARSAPPSRAASSPPPPGCRQGAA